ncbi:MAG: 30S ribosomal protein S2 [Bacteroidetes bacterium MED-G17]|nr:MAG: 30S ribosomal protein S2 [Bacteroidetes bacterium TMED39]PDH52431.1 MAG: 30S ribosomal protein S2 [Bacteroidetes bacterium MED-G17]CAI8278068.1 MAG: 30S ribosomal protein S2 [Bacteroidetes bacterium MED-G17]|tara:strand:+ start:827 stop:1588 length:762 start_codon:yes stop_codon:yes gene_type:complete
MDQLKPEDLLEAGVHYGHLTRKWNPRMAPYIFMEQNGIHIIDVNKSLSKLEEAQNAIRNIARTGRKILFVATKKQAQGIVAEAAREVRMPYVVERWLGGMLTNYATVKKSIKKMQNIGKMESDGTFENMNKKERLMKTREKEKLARVLGGIVEMNRLPAALFVVDTNREQLAIAEALKLNIPIFGVVDTNSDPTKIDFPIPSNDDAAQAIQLVTSQLTAAIQEGLTERKKLREEKKQEDEKAEQAAETTQEKA